jgi:hypothetical protein
MDEDGDNVHYSLDKHEVLIENTIPTCVFDLICSIKELIAPIFDQVAKEDVDREIKKCMRAVTPEVIPG